jgi:hypothetical protein
MCALERMAIALLKRRLRMGHMHEPIEKRHLREHAQADKAHAEDMKARRCSAARPRRWCLH